MASASVEDYLKAIYLLQTARTPATTRGLADGLGVRMASVTGMVKQLHAAGYVRHERYRGVQLTAKGRRLALRVLRRHRIIELFLSKVLGLPWDEVHEDAEALEHAASDRVIERLNTLLGSPAFDPHGAPIPHGDGTISPLNGRLLSDCEVGHRGRILCVSDKDPAFLRYLAGIGIRIGLRFRLVDKAPFDGPLAIHAGRKKIVLGHPAATRVLVSPP
ncbi:MAG: metal-dependent transcriptional regulator [Planctomycetes bacterium]|nr:metal-dependent transcriptional regulator [Planctomycetota bacterium]